MLQAAHSIRALLITDDHELRQILAQVLKGPAFAVAGAIADSAAATQVCQEVQPDVAVVDASMKEGQGFAAVQDIMAFRPTPILVLTDKTGSKTAFKALSLGALDVMGRPTSGALEPFAKELCDRLRLLSGVRVIQHVSGRHGRKQKSAGRGGGPPVVGIAASLGGPKALAALLKGLPRDLGAPICVVQHISVGFAEGLAAWLASESGLPVHEAIAGEPLRTGVVLVAPSNVHLAVGARDEVVLDQGLPVGGFRPSGSVLLASLAERYGARVIGVVLTGMGRDGADGLSAVRSAGGRTLVQDEGTSTVYGMPRAAVEEGAAQQVLPIEEMAPAIVNLVRELSGARLRGG
jgi:two-component system chemotaxis response regulator CheB